MGGTIMKLLPNFAPLLEAFFTQRLTAQRKVSPNTIASYRDTFHLLLEFTQHRIHKLPSSMTLSDIDASLICAFLDHMEQNRSVSIRTRNLRLTAIRSCFSYLQFEYTANLCQIKQDLAITSKRKERILIGFLTRQEIDALISAPDIETWDGRRDHAFLLVAIQTGMRLSEMTGLRKSDLELGIGPYARCVGKGRKERCTPFTKQTVKVLKSWLKEPARKNSEFVFPSIHGEQMSSDAVQYLVAKYVANSRNKCPSLIGKRVTPHVLRHTSAMELLQSGVEPTVIALWLGHESIKTTQIYLDANLAIKEAALAKMIPIEGISGRFQPTDKLLKFLKSL